MEKASEYKIGGHYTHFECNGDKHRGGLVLLLYH